MQGKQTFFIASGVALIIACSWFVGHRLTDHTSSEQVPQDQPSAPLKPLKAKALSSSDKNAPSTPVHEKAFLEEQLKTNPGHPPILLRLGEVERSMGQMKEARQHLEQALKADPTLLDAHLELSLVCYELKDIDEAQRQNLLVLKQDPKQVDALYNLGAIAANRGQFADARRYWQDAVKNGADSASGRNAAAGLTKLPQIAQ